MVVEEVFGDTNYWLAIFLPDDSLHARAIEIGSGILTKSRIVTSDLVVIEVLNALSAEPAIVKNKAFAAFEHFRTSRSVIIYPYTPKLLEEAGKLYVFSDKNWSIVDCSSFIIMRERKIKSALTYDRHFEQAGFQALLREP